MTHYLETHHTQKVTIEKLNDRGDGLALLESVKEHPVVADACDKLKDKQYLRVPFTLPGEVVEISIRHKSRFELVGKLESVIEPSKDRVDAPCPHYETCGGCSLQHMSETAYTDFKRNLVQKAFVHHSLEPSMISDPIIIGAGKRRRIDFMARKWDGEAKMGFHEALSKKPFNVKACPLVDSEIPKLFSDLRECLVPLLEQEKVIHIFITKAQNGIDMLLAGFKNAISSHNINDLKAFAEKHQLAKLSYKVKKREHAIFDRVPPTVRFGEHDVPVTAFGFLQATQDSDEIFGSYLKENMDQNTPLKVVDLFCGRGTLSLNITKLGHHVKGYECDGQALSALRTVQDPNLTVFDRNLFESPLTHEELNEFDAVVMNPPRAGAEAQTKEIAKSNCRQLIYISCNADSFARDTKMLLDSGFTLKNVTPVDQFTWTPHIEIMAYFERAS